MSAKRKEFTCEVCGIISSSTASNYYKQRKKYGISRCKECAKKASVNTIKTKYQNIKTNKSEIIVECPICKQKRTISYRQYKSNSICRSCSIKQSHKENKYLLSYNDRINNEEFKKSVKNGILKVDKETLFRNAKNGAKYWKDNIKKSLVLKNRNTEEYRNKLKKVWDNEEYRNKMSEIFSNKAIELWKSNTYRNKMAIVRSNQLRNKRSTQHQHLCDILDDLNINYETEYVIGPWSFDCLINDRNILIEIQGDYWHSLPKSIRLDKSKSTYINEYYPQYKIIYFYEHEFYQNEAVINRLKHELGIDRLSQINFNFIDVIMKIVKSDYINDFMYKYHYIGPINHSLNFGYFLNDVLIACCSYSPLTRKETASRLGYKSSEIRELSRFCIHPLYQKKNFASWCISKSLKWIEKNKNWKATISFADNTVGHSGIIYRASNFKYDGTSDKSYYYVSNTGYVMHKKTLYNRAIKMGMTEKEFAFKFGYTKKTMLEKNRYIYYLRDLSCSKPKALP